MPFCSLPTHFVRWVGWGLQLPLLLPFCFSPVSAPDPINWFWAETLTETIAV